MINITSLQSSYQLSPNSSLFRRDKHNTGGNFLLKRLSSFPQRKKIAHLFLILGPSSLFHGRACEFVWISENSAYFFGAYVKVCKRCWVCCITEKSEPSNLAVAWPQITFREQIAIFSLACSKCKFFSISFSFWQCSCKRLCWFF